MPSDHPSVAAAPSPAEARHLFWAKSPRDDPSSGSYHPLICHLIDVATVARAIWTDILTPASRRAIAQDLGVSADGAGKLIGFWAGTHDIGKCCPAFQLQLPKAEERFLAAGLTLQPAEAKAPHGIVSARVLAETLPRRFGTPAALARRVATAVGGHHGRFPAPGEPQNISTTGAAGKARWDSFRDDLLDALARLVQPRRELQTEDVSNPTAFWIAGLISVADWIGSNEDYFTYLVPDGEAPRPINLEDYAERARSQTEAALHELGWTGWHPTGDHLTFEQMFGFDPNPLQTEILRLAPQLGEPGLVIVEAPMGEGKTEAAEFLADHWTLALDQGGSYFALPTQATSNQMFSRVSRFLKKRYPGEIVQLQLLHGHASLSAELDQLRRNGYRLFAPSAIAEDEPGKTADVVAAAWFTNRKRGLLAPFGVGTVDQALMSVLQVKHVFVRLFGLAHKTVIIDEVHAYDTYMSTLLDQLLRWLAALGSSVVLLSATLPDARRRELVNAFREGLTDVDAPVAVAAYPRVTWYTQSHGADACSIGTSDQSRKSLSLHRLETVTDEGEPDNNALGDYLQQMLQGGGCAAVVCNTVRRAQEVFTALKPFFPGDADDGLPQLDLIHSRFLLEERQVRESRVLQRFGPSTTPDAHPLDVGSPAIQIRRPSRSVLVATQVIEQSLDIDFDLMVTDMAPLDLMLQRSGRLHRHPQPRPRPDRLRSPVLGVVQRAVNSGDAPLFEQGTAFVYDRHVLLRSWLSLIGRDAIQIPDDIGTLIESVYDARPCPPDLPVQIAAKWAETLQKQVDDRQAHEAEAKFRYIKRPDYGGPLGEMLADPREEDDPDLPRAFQALTRLTDQPSVETVLLFAGGNGTARLRANGTTLDLQKEPATRQVRDLLLRSTSITGWGVSRALPSHAPRAWDNVSLLRHHRLLLLDGDQRATAGDYEIRVDDELGVVITNKRKED